MNAPKFRVLVLEELLAIRRELRLAVWEQNELEQQDLLWQTLGHVDELVHELIHAGADVPF